MPPQRHPVTVRVLAGTLASQPLTFAHLLDLTGDAIDLDHVEVICGTDPARRLRHVFGEGVSQQIEDAQALDTTLVLIFPQAGYHPASSPHLRDLGLFPGSRVQAGNL